MLSVNKQFERECNYSTSDYYGALRLSILSALQQEAVPNY
jgi:hypothetical protein